MRKLTCRLRIIHHVLLCVGGILGFFLGYVLDGVQWDYSADLARARELGIVSKPILNNYPKPRDVLTFILAVGLPVAGALAVWLPWSFKRRNVLCRLLYEKGGGAPSSRPTHRLRPILFVVAALLPVAAFFDPDRFYAGEWNDLVGAWPFLGEEGVLLEWTQRILNGEVQGRDFFCVYGPLMVYPLALLQEIAGPLVSLGRWYAFILNLISYILLAFIINRVVRSSIVALPSLLLMVMLYPWMTYSANLTPLRVVLGIMPLVSLARFRTSGKAVWLAVAGATCAASFLYSQEVGVCALLASLVAIGFGYFEQRNLTVLLRRASIMLAGGAVMLLPFVFYFMANGALSQIMDNLLLYPRYAMLGYAGLVFPSIADALVSFTMPFVFDNYWIIATYSVGATLLLVRLWLGRSDAGNVEFAFLLVFGLLLFRSALGRSSIDRASFVSPPAFLLLVMALDQCACRLKKNRGLFRICTAMVMLLIVITVSVKTSLSQGGTITGRNRFVSNMFPKAKIAGLERNDVRHHPDTDREIRLIADFFRTHPTPDGYVYFFPNEPAYYFIFNKKNPTRYATSYLAATSEMRRELVADLEKRKPLYVVYSRSTWRIDGIPSYVQVPEVYGYLETNYEVLLDYGPVVFLKRKQAHG